jgi:hypothetical protein
MSILVVYIEAGIDTPDCLLFDRNVKIQLYQYVRCIIYGIVPSPLLGMHCNITVVFVWFSWTSIAVLQF